MNGDRKSRLTIIQILFLVFAAAFVTGCSNDSSPSGKTACGTVPIASPTGLGDAPVVLGWAIPPDMSVDPADLNVDAARRMVDRFAWESFVALNWPASSICRGTPFTDLTVADDWTSNRVWETFKASYELFQATDDDWDPVNVSFDDPAPAGACGELENNATSLLGPPDFQKLVYEEYQAGLPRVPFVDQQGNTVWYEITFNRDVFNYIRDKGLAATGSYDYGGPITGGGGQVDFPTGSTGASGAGAIEIKAAWRIMTSEDDTGRYFTQEVVIYDGRDCRTTTMGLVGLHIIRKVDSSPKWIWATFEHEDNVPKSGTNGDGRNYSFFSLDCAENEPADCPGQTAVSDTEYACCPNLIPYPDPTAGSINQVTRLVSIQADQEMNERFRKAYADVGSPFQYYLLVGAQWAKPQGELPSAWQRPCNPNGPWGVDSPSPGEPCYEQIPGSLRNTSMETLFVQTDREGIQYSSDSCMNCHQAGGIDGSFLWQDAMFNQYEISNN
jgi:hypothetical protein